MDKLRYKDRENLRITKGKSVCSYLKLIIDNPCLRLRTFLFGIFGLVLASDVFVQNVFEWKTYDDCHVQRKLHGAMDLLEEYGNSIVMMDIALGFGSACLLCAASIMLLISALMRSYSFRYFAAPAILVITVEIIRDVTEALLFLIYMPEYLDTKQILSSTCLHALWLFAELFLWVGAVRFFERSPPAGSNFGKVIQESSGREASALELQI